MYKKVYYERKSNTIHLWEIENGKEVKKTIPFEYEYYVENEEGKFTDVHGNRFKKMIAKNKKEMMSIKDAGLNCCETDLQEVTKFLQSYYEGQELKVDMDHFNVAYIDIETTGKSKPEDPEDAINCITVISSQDGKAYTFGTSDFTKKGSKHVKNYCYVPDELGMLTKFVQWFRKQKFDVISGWNSMTFDVPYIVNRIRKLTSSGLELKLSPLNRVNERKTMKFDRLCTVFEIVGLVHLDYMDLFDDFTFETLTSKSLNFVCNHVLGEGKLEFEGQLNELWKDNWNKFVEYNVQDTRLLEKLEKKLKYIELAITLGYESLVPFEKFYSKVAVIEGYILRDHRKHNMVMTDREKPERDWWLEGRHYVAKEKNIRTGEIETVYQNCKIDDGEKTFEPFKIKGGYVRANRGYYENNMSFDVESEYPHIIMRDNISPETKVILPTEEQIKEQKLIPSAINGLYFRSDMDGFLPVIVKKIFDERKKFKNLMFKYKAEKNYVLAQYYDNQQQIRKIMINSMYGVFANNGFHYYDPDNARAITRGGRQLIRYLSNTVDIYFKDNWHKVAHKYFPKCGQIEPLKKDLVCLIDTDSNYLCLDEIKKKCAPDMDFLEFAGIMENKVLQPFFNKVLDIYAKKIGRPQIINFKREGVITQQFILAKKKYITRLLVNEKEVFEKPKLKFTGVEVKRSDTPAYCRLEIENAVDNILNEMDKQSAIKLLRKIKKEFKQQDIMDIAYSTGITEYTKYAPYPTQYYVNNGLSYIPHTTIHARGAMCYNYMVKKHNLPYLEIENGSKMKYIYVFNRNLIKTYVVGFIGNYPEEFNEYFEIDYDLQFEKAFLSTIQRMFDVLGWGKINLKGSKLGKFVKKRKK